MVILKQLNNHKSGFVKPLVSQWKLGKNTSFWWTKSERIAQLKPPLIAHGSWMQQHLDLETQVLTNTNLFILLRNEVLAFNFKLPSFKIMLQKVLGSQLCGSHCTPLSVILAINLSYLRNIVTENKNNFRMSWLQPAANSND